MNKLAFLAAAWLFLSSGGCGYGPERTYVVMENIGPARSGEFVIAVLRCMKVRDPIGLSAEPDGGIHKVIDQSAVVFKCNGREGTVRQLGTIRAPASTWIEFRPWFRGWTGDTFYVSLSGHPRQKGASAALTQRFVRFVDGSYTFVEEIPAETTMLSGDSSDPIRYSMSGEQILCRDRDTGRVLSGFVVDQKNCRLIAR